MISLSYCNCYWICVSIRVAVHHSQGPPLPGSTTPMVHHSQGPPLPESTTPRVHNSQGGTTPRVRRSQGPPLPGSTTPRVAPLPGFAAPRVRHAQGPPFPGSITPRVRQYHGEQLYSVFEHITNPTSVSANLYYCNQFQLLLTPVLSNPWPAGRMRPAD